MKSQSSCTGPVRLSRRQVLQVGIAPLVGLSLPQLLHARSVQRAATTADSCIIIFLNGGPSHLDMWDMKPDGPAETRGEFRPIASSLPGVPLCEHLPRLAKQLHRCTLVRSVQHRIPNSHALAVYAGLTGHERENVNVIVGAAPHDYPAVGSVVGMHRPPAGHAVPYVFLPYVTTEGKSGPPQPGFFGGVLGRARDPLFVLRDPNTPGFDMPGFSHAPEVPAERLESRRQLLDSLPGTSGRTTDRSSQLETFQHKAFDLLTGPGVQEAFQVDREPDRVRESYGRNIYGQSVLLARRLIEAGTRVATISWAPDANATWDTHGQNFPKLKQELLPQLDAAVSSLLADLADRGRLDRTLVAVLGEFGRTPKINGNGGRDHWNYCYTMMLAGGGIKPGHVHGSSDAMGAQPSSHPVHPADIIATIYHCLGVPTNLEIHDRLGRPMELLPWGQPITDILTSR